MTMRLLVVLVLATSLTGCSVINAFHVREPTSPPSCGRMLGASAIDFAAAAVLVGMFDAATSDPTGPDHASIGDVEALAVGAGLVLVSGIDGLAAAGSCHVQQRARETRAREEAALEQSVAAREQAWKLTQQAEAAARAGDCATVVRLGPEIAATDRGVHDVVFARDHGVGACLQPTQVR